MKSNFSFLEKLFPALEKHGSLSESYLYSDPNTCLYKLGIFSETVVNYMFDLDKFTEPTYDNTFANRIKILKREGLLSRDIDDILYHLRKKRNEAVHAGHDSFEDCKTLLKMAHSLAIWFMQTYGDWNFNAGNFVMPEDN